MLTGCTAPVARDLDEFSANRIVVALEQGGVSATKELDSQNDGKWLVSVQRTEVSYSLGVLFREGLPARERPGVAESANQGSLIPSAQSEQARLLASIASDLERSLGSIDGVASARVHLAVPAIDLLVDTSERAVPSASVLIRHHGSALPLPAVEIQRLIAGAVANLTPDRVVVVTMPISPIATSRRRIVPFGPFAVAGESVAGLRIIAGGFVGLNLSMLAMVLFFWLKVRKLRSGPPPKNTTLSMDSW